MSKMITEIMACRENFGPAPRNFSFWNRMTYFSISKPIWAKRDPDEKLNLLFDNYLKVYKYGMVVWGHIVQANSLLFEEGKEDCPGELLFSLNRADCFDPEILSDIAHDLFALKGTEPDDKEFRPIANHLTDEYTRVFGLDVPKTISGKLTCKISTTYFIRKHLPFKKLTSGFLPLVVYPNKPHFALPLPERYWPSSLLMKWY